MTFFNWQLKQPVSAIIFDCDGTLTTLEGIDELAKYNGVNQPVSEITAQAMNSSGLNPDLYQKRLQLVQPTHQQVIHLGYQYFVNQIPNIRSIIELFLRLKKTVYLISAGLLPAVTIFGELLYISRKNIYAVDIHFDKQGFFIDYEKQSPLVNSDGKRLIIEELKKQHSGLIHVGDGINDYIVHDLVTRFIGFGGAFYRESIAKKSEYYIKTMSMTPLLPLALTQQEFAMLNVKEQTLYQDGLDAIQQGKVKYPILQVE